MVQRPHLISVTETDHSANIELIADSAKHMRHLYLLRHAKSLWIDPTLEDFERPLSPRGFRDAKKIASYLERTKPRIELVLCSSAKRTTQTLDFIQAALKAETKVLIEDSLYTFDLSELLERLRKVPNQIRSVLIIGHNPGIQGLALQMTLPGQLRQRIALKYPTAALTIVELENDSWDLSEPAISKTSFVAPADLE